MIVIHLNGEERLLEEPVTLLDLLSQFQISTKSIAIAINAAVVPHSEFQRTRVKDRDRVEIIHPVGGG